MCILSIYSIYEAHSCRVEIVHWVAESARPFEIVANPGFQCLMRTGCPNCYLPDLCTVSHDVQNTFTQVHEKLAVRLQVDVSFVLIRHKLKNKPEGIQRRTQLLHRCMDSAKPQVVCGYHCPSRNRRRAVITTT